MKILHYISFNIPRERQQDIRCALREIACEQWWQPAPNERGLCSFENIFDSTDPLLKKVLELAVRARLCPFERIEHVYTDAELRSFPLLALECDRPTVEDDYPGRGTTYDFSTGCPVCGRGAVQTSALMIPLTGLPNPKKTLMTHTHAGHMLLNERLMGAMRDEGITGADLRQVRFYRNDEPLPWWQIIGTQEMPEMILASKKVGPDLDPKYVCPTCRRDARGGSALEPFDFAYDRRLVDAAALPDVVRTWECFGPSYVKGIPPGNELQGIAPAMILVKPRVFDLFRRLKVRGACFTPIRIE